jgi:hypothetical protein
MVDSERLICAGSDIFADVDFVWSEKSQFGLGKLHDGGGG